MEHKFQFLLKNRRVYCLCPDVMVNLSIKTSCRVGGKRGLTFVGDKVNLIDDFCQDFLRVYSTVLTTDVFPNYPIYLDFSLVDVTEDPKSVVTRELRTLFSRLVYPRTDDSLLATVVGGSHAQSLL